jgi:DnaJ like chaperone protein
MSWHGKIIGGFVGFVMGGPLGAAAGATLGHAFVDKKKNVYRLSETHSGHALPSPEQAHMIFFEAVFSMLAKMSKVDGRVSEKEVAVIENFMKDELHLDINSRIAAVQIFRQAIKSSESFETSASQFYMAFSNQPYIIELVMDILFRVASTDGHIQKEEEELLLSASNIFNYTRADYERMKSKYAQTTNHYYAVLNCEPTASNEDIKKQFRKLAGEYHPDKIQAKGLPEGFIKFANEKFAEIQEAYSAIRKERAF